jgi:ADP-dependent NAD(P)H-hydrate dehydratase / NAD(P)H-hydrate epimerase
MQPVLTSAESRAFDKYLIEEIGIPSLILMENAARGAIEAIEDWLIRDQEIAILCGPGNNGGDGMALARLMVEKNHNVTIFLAGDRKKLSTDAHVQYEALAKIIDPDEIYSFTTAEEVLEIVDRPDIVVDALLGTGSKGSPKGAIAEGIKAIQTFKDAGSKILALDLPTGLEADAGVFEAHSSSLRIVRADRTVTMGAPKIGFYQGISREYTGEVSIARLGAPYPTELFGNGPATYLISQADVAPLITPFPFNASKYMRGRILVICGSRGMTGAAIMSARSALKSGAGWVTVAVPHSERAIVAQAMPEFVTIGIAEQEDGSPTLEAWNDIQRELERCDVVLIGCGYLPLDETADFVRKVVATVQKPMVIDGGALRSIARHLEILDARKASTILTPNTGELSALAEMSREEVEQNLPETARGVATKHHVTVIAKSAPEFVLALDGTTYINTTGGPGMGTAGTGGVLAGITATMLAHNPDSPANAAIAATYLCGLAGDSAAREMTTHAMSATDLIKKLPEAFRALGVE